MSASFTPWNRAASSPTGSERLFGDSSHHEHIWLPPIVLMPTERRCMRHTPEILRHKWLLGHGCRPVTATLDVNHGVTARPAAP